MSDKRVSDLSAWKEGELVDMPSGRVMRLRRLDPMEVLTADGQVPNFLLPLVQGKAHTIAPNADQMLKLAPILRRVAEQAVVEPPIVKSFEEANAGKGLLLSWIPLDDKMAMLSFALGGAAAVEQANRFLQKQAQSLDTVSEQKQRVAESEDGDQ